MKIDMTKHRKEYMTQGFTVVDDLIPDHRAIQWANEAILRAGAGMARQVDGMFRDTHYKFKLFDGLVVPEAFPSMMAFYEATTPFIAAVTQQDVETSPFPKSAVTVKVHEVGDENQHGWHYDTQPITVLLYLTHAESNEDGGTVIALGDDLQETVRPKRGRMLIMGGRNTWHKGLGPTDSIKVVCPWNYYVAGDYNRPTEIDEFYDSQGVE